MRISRRQALSSLGLAAFSRLAWSFMHPLRPRVWEGTPPTAIKVEFPVEFPVEDAIEDRLREDLARLAPRVYSEEGIPVFLACMNLVADRTLHETAAATPPPLSAALASTFQRNAEAFRRIRPNAQAKDIAPIIEVLADRDFTSGGTEGQL